MCKHYRALQKGIPWVVRIEPEYSVGGQSAVYQLATLQYAAKLKKMYFANLSRSMNKLRFGK